MKRCIMIVAISVILLSHLVIASPNDENCLNACSKHGTCDEVKSSNGTTEWKCTCLQFYAGDDCSQRWKNDKIWNPVFIIYSIVELVLQLIIVCYSVWQIWLTWKHALVGGWRRWTLVTAIYILALAAGLMRIVSFAIDPHAYRGIMPKPADEMLFNVPLILWLSGGFMLFLYWIELQAVSGIKELLFLSKLRPYLMVFTIAISAILIPVDLWVVVGKTGSALWVYNGFLIFVFLFLIILLTVSGFRLSRIMKKVYDRTRVNRFKEFLMKLNRYIFAIDGFLLSSIITLALFQFVNARQNRWTYVILHLLLRVQEFLIVFCTLIFVGKKKPDSNKTTTGDSASMYSVERLSIDESVKSDSEHVPESLNASIKLEVVHSGEENDNDDTPQGQP